VLAAATDGKPRTLQAIWLARSNKILGKKSVNFYSTFSVRRNLRRQKSVAEKFYVEENLRNCFAEIVRGKLSGKLNVHLSWTIRGRFVLRENCSWKNYRK